MSKKKQTHEFKVWVQIEAEDLKTGENENVSEPEKIGTFNTLEEAQDFVSNLPDGDY